MSARIRLERVLSHPVAVAVVSCDVRTCSCTFSYGGPFKSKARALANDAGWNCTLEPGGPRGGRREYDRCPAHARWTRDQIHASRLAIGVAF